MYTYSPESISYPQSGLLIIIYVSFIGYFETERGNITTVNPPRVEASGVIYVLYTHSGLPGGIYSPSRKWLTYILMVDSP